MCPLNKRGYAFAALLLTLCLLCGCSNVNLSSVTAFLTGEEQTESEPQPVEETPPEETEMAADTVLEEIQEFEVLRLAYQAEYGLNPYTTVSLCNRTILSLLYEPLYLVNSSFQPEPVLAAETELSEDGRTATITLRSGVKFHSGKTLTAQDVVYSFEQAKACDYYGNRFIHIDSFTALDARTLAVVNDTSFETVALLLDFPIIRDGTVEAASPDGTGPFVWTKGSSTKLERSETWWGEEWVLDCQRVELTLCDTSTDIRDNFEYGQVNLVCTDPNSAAYATYHSDSDYELWSCNTTVMQYIGFNHNSKVWSSDALCAAVTYAVDRDTIVAQDLGGFAIASALPASPLSPGYDAGLAADYHYDLETFQAMLEEAQIEDYTGDGILDIYYKGYAIPVEGEMIVSASSPQRLQTANRIAGALNELGFDITVSALDDSEFQEALLYGNYDLYYGEVRLSANFDLGSFFREGGSLSYGGLSSGTMVALCAAMLENSGNAYDLHKQIMDRGMLCPILFKSYAVYTTRGAASHLDPALDWVIH